MLKTLMVAVVAVAFAPPFVAKASALDDTLVVAQAGADRRQDVHPPKSPASADAAVSRFDSRDKNRDGFISRDEARDASELDTRFSELDTNNDGKLSREEYDALGKSATGSTSSPASSTRNSK